jgi:hypothetical protein
MMVSSWSSFAERGLDCFVGVTSFTTRISSSHPSRSFPAFDLPRMGYPLRHLPVSRVDLFLSIPECVNLAYELARPS